MAVNTHTSMLRAVAHSGGGRCCSIVVHAPCVLVVTPPSHICSEGGWGGPLSLLSGDDVAMNIHKSTQQAGACSGGCGCWVGLLCLAFVAREGVVYNLIKKTYG